MKIKNSALLGALSLLWLFFPTLGALASSEAHGTAVAQHGGGHGFTWIGSLAHSLNITIPESILTYALVCLGLVVVSLIYRKKLSTADNQIIPDKGITLKNLVEAYGLFILNQCKSVIGEKKGAKYVPYVGSLFIVILASNFIGLIPGVMPPTETISLTFALGIFSFFYYNYEGIRKQGFINYMKHFAGPVWYIGFLIFPLEIISNLFRPLTLSLRLRGNMFGDHQVLAAFNSLAPIVIPIIFIMMGIIVCIVQAYVFTLLSMVYIATVIEDHDHDTHEAVANHH